MNRFDSNNEEFEFEDEAENYSDSESDSDMDMSDLTLSNHRIHNEFLDTNQDLNLSVLRHSIDMAKSSWFWRFRSTSTKIRIVTEIYYMLLDLVLED